jgi:hypothetical protein
MAKSILKKAFVPMGLWGRPSLPQPNASHLRVRKTAQLADGRRGLGWLKASIDIIIWPTTLWPLIGQKNDKICVDLSNSKLMKSFGGGSQCERESEDELATS